MRLTSSRSLVQYWDGLRAGRLAPLRTEIEPADIATLLPVTFMLDCSRAAGFRFRLAGTSICEQLGRELRGVELAELIDPRDRRPIGILLESVVTKGGIAVVQLEATGNGERKIGFELVAMPVMHASRSVNRLLGSLTAIDKPVWLGTAPISPFRVAEMDIVSAARTRTAYQPPAIASESANDTPENSGTAGLRRFRVIEGGRSR